jgi:hypothetical protein
VIRSRGFFQPWKVITWAASVPQRFPSSRPNLAMNNAAMMEILNPQM